MKELLDALERGEVITLESAAQINELHDYLMVCGHDPNDYRRDGLDIWKA